MHDEMNDAHVYEMKNAISGSQTPGVLQIRFNLSICGDLFRHRDEFKQKECMNYEHVNI
jgi:hypothetical protein